MTKAIGLQLSSTTPVGEASFDATIGWLTSDGRVLVEDLYSCLTQPASNRGLTPCSLACRQAHAVESGGRDISDSAVSLRVSECPTPKGSEIRSIEWMEAEQLKDFQLSSLSSHG